MNESLFAGADQGLPGMLSDAPKPHGIGDILSQILTGPTDPRLTPEQNAAARKQALIQGGLATILASSQNPGALAAVAMGAQYGQQSRAQYTQQTVQQQQQAQLAQLFTSGQINEEDLKHAYAQAIATGNTQLADAIVGMLKYVHQDPEAGTVLTPGQTLVGNKTGKTIASLPAAAVKPEHKLEHEDLGNAIRYFYSDTPNITQRYDYKGAAPSAPDRTQHEVQLVDPKDGKVYTYLADNSGKLTKLGQTPPKAAAGDERAALAIPLLQKSAQTLDKYESQLDLRSIYMGHNGLARTFFTTEAGQAVKVAGGGFVENIFILHKVPRPSDKLREMYVDTFTPQVGDKPATLKLKRQLRDLALQGKLPAHLVGPTAAEAVDDSTGAAPDSSDPFANVGKR